MSDFDASERDDAVIEDTTSCQCCAARLVLGDNDCLVVEVPQHNGTVAVLVLCHVCAGQVHDHYRDWLRAGSICEHGVAEDKYCPECREDYRQARAANGDEA